MRFWGAGSISNRVHGNSSPTDDLILSIDDILHFGFLFLIVFITFAMTGTWAFGKESEEFATFQKGMTTQVTCRTSTNFHSMNSHLCSPSSSSFSVSTGQRDTFSSALGA